VRQLIRKILKEQTGQDNRPNKIMKMIDDIGLYKTLKIAGGYDNVSNYINLDDLTYWDKLKFIREVIKTKASELGTGDSIPAGYPPIVYYQYENMKGVMKIFYSSGVSVDRYENDEYKNSPIVLYDWLPDETFDEIFKWMIKLSQE